MPTATGSGARAILRARGEALLGSELAFANFLLKTLEAIEDADLLSLPTEAIEAILRQAHSRFVKHDPTAMSVDVFSPYGAAAEAAIVVTVASPDTPFIVDSVLAAIRAAGATIRLVAHPVFPVDPVIRPLRVLSRPQPEALAVSFVHVHIDPLDDLARLAHLRGELERTMLDVGRTVADHQSMLDRLDAVVDGLKANPSRASPEDLAEAGLFLHWLGEHNFVFLGLREYRLARADRTVRLEPLPESGLGILRDPELHFLRDGSAYVEMTEQHAQFLLRPDVLMVGKAAVRSRVHRRAHMDYVGIKLTDAQGALTGELRILGLFTSSASTRPVAETPLVRKTVETVLARAGRDPRSHAGKALAAALETYPRDELFQLSADELAEFAAIIAALPDRPGLRVLPRIDRFDNFVSVLLYMPRDRYDSDLRARIGTYLAEAYDGHLSAFYPFFPEGELVRVHFVIGRDGSRTPRPDRARLEADIADLARTYPEKLVAAAPRPADIAGYAEAFPPAWQAMIAAEDALADIAVLRRLEQEGPLALRLLTRPDGAPGLRLYHRDGPLPLSERVPILENFGFRVIDEQTYAITPAEKPAVLVHDMVLALAPGEAAGLADAGKLEAALAAVLGGTVENDAFNALVLRAGLAIADVVLLRALGRYLLQLSSTYSLPYLARALAAHPAASRALVGLFHARLDPLLPDNAERAEQEHRHTLLAELEATASLDEDTILRRYLALVEAALRANHEQRDAEGRTRPALAIKFDPHGLDFAPRPRPWREIFVHAPRVEGVHLRLGPIARGGIRWSDRPEDFRTEVLGLVKAQQVKNAVIVPTGAKGGFVVRGLPAGASRKALAAAGRESYELFVGALLDLTDTLVGETVLPPVDVYRRDADDPYLVVAADKGTAHFSDNANAIALDREYWLGDAFASGGSHGYDHKAMGITARGAFVAIERHFRELGRDIGREGFTIAGIGDMSGDVFGNGLLLHPTARLVAAFDHRDIFIDPDPDPEKSLAARRRLFDMAGSSWQDYDRAALSDGGGVHSRTQKAIALSPQARRALGIEDERLAPNALIRAILRAPVDLLWLGGIGTYVAGPGETDAEVGDRANDAVRVGADGLRARVVGEGANLGFTQRGRIAYALAGGRINTDAIDNAAGVSTSDLEVNIKLALAPLVASGALDGAERDALLQTLTGEVADLVLAGNAAQVLALSLAERRAVADSDAHARLLARLAAEAHLDPALEQLPDAGALAARAATGQGLTRPELAVLLAYLKLDLKARLVEAGPPEALLEAELLACFPPGLVDRHREALLAHPLRRQIVMTRLANGLANRGGLTFPDRLAEASGADLAAISLAFLAAIAVFELDELHRLVEGVDAAAGAMQLVLHERLQALLADGALWLLRHAGPLDHPDLVPRYRHALGEIRGLLPAILPAGLAARIAAEAQGFEQAGIKPALARRVAELQALRHGLDIAEISVTSGQPVGAMGEIYLALLERFALGAFAGPASRGGAADRFERLAFDRALSNLATALRLLAIEVAGFDGEDNAGRLAAWEAARASGVARLDEAIAGLDDDDMNLARLSVVAGLVADLARR